MPVSPRCPDGRPHYWIVNDAGTGAECKFCLETRDDLDNGAPRRSEEARRGLPPASPKSHYRKAADYVAMKAQILQVYKTTGNIAATSRAFNPPIPPTSLRQWIEKWTRTTAEMVLPLAPGLVAKGDPDTVARFAASVKGGDIEVKREPLNPIELAKLFRDSKLTQAELARKFEIKQSAVSETLSLLRLQPEVQYLIIARAIMRRHGRLLLKVSDRQKQVELARWAAENKASVAQLRRKIGRVKRKRKG